MLSLYTTACQKVIRVGLSFKLLFLILISSGLLFYGCSDSNGEIRLLDKDLKTLTNTQKNDLSKKQSSDVKLEISKLEAENKLAIAKVQADNLYEIEKIKSNTTKEVALADAKVRSEDTRVIVYIASITGILLFVLIVLIYLNSKKNREIKLKLHEAELKQQKEIAEQEMEEKRLQMMINLITEDKLPKQMQEELVTLMGKKSNLVIESKNS